MKNLFIFNKITCEHYATDHVFVDQGEIRDERQLIADSNLVGE